MENRSDAQILYELQLSYNDGRRVRTVVDTEGKVCEGYEPSPHDMLTCYVGKPRLFDLTKDDDIRLALGKSPDADLTITADLVSSLTSKLEDAYTTNAFDPDSLVPGRAVGWKYVGGGEHTMLYGPELERLHSCPTLISLRRLDDVSAEGVTSDVTYTAQKGEEPIAQPNRFYRALQGLARLVTGR